MTFEYADMKGKTAIVTGATSGIGLAAAIGLSRAGAELTAIGRDRARLDKAGEAIEAASGSKPSLARVDLASLAEIAAFARDWKAGGNPLAALVNNAGVFTTTRQRSADGIELQFAVNHLAGFWLSLALLPPLAASGDGRVVCVSSESHYAGRIRWRDPGQRFVYFGLRAYDQSKYANVLFVKGLAAALAPDSPVSSYAIDPGLVETSMGSKHSGSLISRLWAWRAKKGTPPEEGADTAVWIASEPRAPRPSGAYWKERATKEPSPRASRPGEVRRLWDLSVAMCERAGFPPDLGGLAGRPE